MCQQGSQACALHNDCSYMRLHRGHCSQRGARRRVGGHAQVIRRLDLPNMVHQGSGKRAIARAQTGQTGALAKGAQHHQVCVAQWPGDAAGTGARKIDVGFVQQQHQWQLQQLQQIRVGQLAAIRVVGRAKAQQLGLVLRNRSVQRRHIQRKVCAARHRHHACALNVGAVCIHAKRRRAVQQHISGVQQHAHRQVNQLVCAGARHQLCGRHAGVLRQQAAQCAAFRIRVNVRVGQRRQCGARFWHRSI